jgi:hypothetical protein
VRALPYLADDLDRTLHLMAPLAADAGITLTLPALWTPADPWMPQPPQPPQPGNARLAVSSAVLAGGGAAARLRPEFNPVGAVVHRGQQVDLAAVASGAAERLAVDRHRPPPAGSDRTGVPIPVGQPGAGHERRWR